MALDKKSVLQYLQHIAFKGDGTLLFRKLDADRDGTCSLEELDPVAADAIAHFRLWAFRKFPGGAIQVFDVFTSPGECNETTKQFTVSSEKRLMRFPTFQAGCKRHNFYLHHRTDHTHDQIKVSGGGGTLSSLREHDVYRQEADPWLKYLFDCLDYSGIGTLNRSDFEFVQNWQPPPWFVVPPDKAGLSEFRKAVLSKHGNFVRGWRKALDLNGTNRVSWSQFVRNCNAMGFIRNLPGIFSALDLEKNRLDLTQGNRQGIS
jgi:hypothetical protein